MQKQNIKLSIYVYIKYTLEKTHVVYSATAVGKSLTKTRNLSGQISCALQNVPLRMGRICCKYYTEGECLNFNYIAA